jgi:hypothetical protein
MKDKYAGFSATKETNVCFARGEKLKKQLHHRGGVHVRWRKLGESSQYILEYEAATSNHYEQHYQDWQNE